MNNDERPPSKGGTKITLHTTDMTVEKQKREIQDYLWLSKIYPTADHDFEVTTNSGVVNMLEVKSTNSNFNTPFYWSRNERKLFLIGYLINSLDDSGFLNRKIHAITSDLLVNNELAVTEKELLMALQLLQQLEPHGIGAQNLQECLLIQLKKLYPENETAFTIIKDYYVPFTNKNFEHISKHLNLDF